jgi:hypothetical protein
MIRFLPMDLVIPANNVERWGCRTCPLSPLEEIPGRPKALATSLSFRLGESMRDAIGRWYPLIPLRQVAQRARSCLLEEATSDQRISALRRQFAFSH